MNLQIKEAAEAKRAAAAPASPLPQILVDEHAPFADLAKDLFGDGTNVTKLVPGSFKAVGKIEECGNWFDGAQPTPLQLQTQMVFMETIGTISRRRVCETGLPNVIYDLRKPGDRERLEGTAEPQKKRLRIVGMPVPIFCLIMYALICFVVVARLLWVITRANSVSQPTKHHARPEQDAYNSGLVSWLSISWCTPWICRFGNSYDPANQKIKASDLGATSFADYECANAYEDFEAVWNQDIKRRGTKVTNMYLVVFRFCRARKVIQLAVLCFFYETLMYLGPTFCVDWTLSYMERLQMMKMTNMHAADLDNQNSIVFMLIIMYTGSPMFMVIFSTLAFLLSAKLQIRLQAALTTAVYQKAQRMPVTGGQYDLRSEQDKDAGKSVNGNSDVDMRSKSYSLVQLINTDINGNLMGFQGAVCKLVTEIPILIGLCFLLFIRMGKAGLIAVGIVVGMAGLTFWVVRQQVIRFRWFQVIVGGRLAFFQEVLFSIRMVKSNAYEPASMQIVNDCRKRELTQLAWMYFWSGIMMLLLFSYPKLICLGGLGGYISLHNDRIRASDIFVMMQILMAFKGCAHTCLTLLPAMVVVGPSMSRLDTMLKLEEAPLPGKKDETEATWLSIWPQKHLRSSPCALRIQGTFLWSTGKPALTDLDLTVRPGEMVAVMGEVGSGKSTLLAAMLGELAPTEDSRLEIPLRVAFHGQVPVICEATLKENVLYWGDWDEKRYLEALHNACLLPDLEILPGGDMVPIGSRGISLSGGQRARVSLARAAYTVSAEAVLIDDPFASVDVPTGQHLLDNLLLGPLMKDRARVVVCQPDRMRAKVFDKIIIMADGKIAAIGTPEEIMKTERYQALLGKVEAMQLKEDLQAGVDNSQGTSQGFEREANQENIQKQAGVAPPELREEEHEGRADIATLHYFISLGKYRNLILSILSYAVFMLMMLMSDLVLVRWSNTILTTYVLGLPNPEGMLYIKATALWFLGGCTAFCLYWFFGITWSLTISGTLHHHIVTRLMRAPLDKFYDKTPVGRVMNRMSFDLTDIDFQMFQKFAGCLGTLAGYLVPLVYVHWALPTWLLCGSIPFYMVVWAVMSRYWNTMVPLRYLNAVTRSDLNSYITEVENGAVSGRAYQVFGVVAVKEMEATDNMLKAGFANICISRWTVNRLTLIYSIFCTSVAVIGVLFLSQKQNTGVGTVGLCLSHISGIIMQAESFLQQLTEMQFQFISMNRLQEYTELPEEREPIQETDGKYYSPVVNLHRSAIGSLAIQRNEGEKLKIVRETGNNQRTVILEKMDDLEAFQAPRGKNMAVLADHPMLYGTVDWHRLQSVNGVSNDAEAMAQELVNGSLESVWLSVRSGWLAAGARVQLTDLVVGYSDYPNDVLRGLNFTIEAKSKTAIAGATGCGKSTMIQTFLRLLEPRAGKIEINDVDLQSIGLLTLRNSFGLVPQDPVLFSGTLRNNLDPFSVYCDAEVWHALVAVQLEEFVKKGGVGLDYYIKADGDNISFGQKQLICIARQILRNPSLLLLDECTSAIDPHTQELVQETIRTCFPNATLVAIAHRLETIMDFDTVVVLDKGRVVEKGPIKELKDAKNGWFAKMLHAKDRKCGRRAGR